MNPHAGKETCYLTREAASPLAEEPDVLAIAFGELATALTRELAAPPTLPETDKKVGESLACEFPGWTEIHPSHPVTPVGQVPSSLGNIKWHNHSHRSSRIRAQHHKMEEQRSDGQGDSSSTLLCRSPMPNPSLEDPPKVPPPGFREIAQSLTKGQPPQVTIKVAQELMPPTLLVGPAMTMLMSTRIN